MDRVRKFTTVLKGFVIGGLVAGGVALLVAPRSGTETRQVIKDNLMEARLKTEAALEDGAGWVKQKAAETQQEVSRLASKVGSDVQTTASEFTQAMNKAAGGGIEQS